MDEHALPPFPDFLADAFPEADLEHSESTLAVVDPEGAILWVNRFWRRFAQENGGHAWRDGVGSYFDGIAPPLRDYYKSLFDNVLTTGEPFEQDYECSSPEKARHSRAFSLDCALRFAKLPAFHYSGSGDWMLSKNTLNKESVPTAS